MQPNRLSVGGVRSIEPVLHRRGQIATHDFVGCIMEFAVNGRPLEPSQALASRGILDRSVLIHPDFCFLSIMVFRPSAPLRSCRGTSAQAPRRKKKMLLSI